MELFPLQKNREEDFSVWTACLVCMPGVTDIRYICQVNKAQVILQLKHFLAITCLILLYGTYEEENTHQSRVFCSLQRFLS